MVHRDLKLSNLLLTVDGKMIICDFGKSLRMEKTFRMPNMHGQLMPSISQLKLLANMPQVLSTVVMKHTWPQRS